MQGSRPLVSLPSGSVVGGLAARALSTFGSPLTSFWLFRVRTYVSTFSTHRLPVLHTVHLYLRVPANESQRREYWGGGTTSERTYTTEQSKHCSSSVNNSTGTKVYHRIEVEVELELHFHSILLVRGACCRSKFTVCVCVTSVKYIFTYPSSKLQKREIAESSFADGRFLVTFCLFFD